jgi:type I restriction enzyme M protein
MNGLQSRWDFHVELEDLNAEAVMLAASIKKNFEELGI